MRRRLGIWGASEESLRLLDLLSANADIDVVRIYDANPEAALARARRLGPRTLASVERTLTDAPDAFLADGAIEAVVDSEGDFQARQPAHSGTALQIVTPLTARLLWGYGVAPRDRKAELLQALHEIVESVDLTMEADALFERMLEIAVGVTGAEGGSLMLLDREAGVLRIRVAQGVEPELWDKIRVPIGRGIAGRVAADGQAIHLRGRADRERYDLMRDRVDVESALCVPLVHGNELLGVLNVHHASARDAFSEEDLVFMEQLARLDAQIIARAQDHARLRSRAARYEAIQEIQTLLRGPALLAERLEAFCQYMAERAAEGIVHLYLKEADGSFRLAATSLPGGRFGGEYRLEPGRGIDGEALQQLRAKVLRHPDGRIGYAALPLLAGSRAIGLLSIQAGEDLSSERSTLESWQEMTAAAAESISRTRRDARLANLAERVDAINETSIRLLSCREPNEVAQLATSSAAMILEADHAILRLQDPTTRRYSIRSYFGSVEGPAQEALFRLDKAVTVEAIRRRAPHLIRDAATTPHLKEFASDMRSVLTAPLRRAGKVVGTLSIYDKVALDRFFTSCFDDEDLQVFGRLVTYVERALDHALSHQENQHHRNFDEETGLPNDEYLAQRLHEEIARAAGRENAVALCVCRLENAEEIRNQGSEAQLTRVIRQLAASMREHLRDFDVLARIEAFEFAVLMPEPGRTPGERVFELARAVADAIAQNESLNQPLRVRLAFGYGIHPADGATRDELLAHARTPRIRMV